MPLPLLIFSIIFPRNYYQRYALVMSQTLQSFLFRLNENLQREVCIRVPCYTLALHHCLEKCLFTLAEYRNPSESSHFASSGKVTVDCSLDCSARLVSWKALKAYDHTYNLVPSALCTLETTPGEQGGYLLHI